MLPLLAHAGAGSGWQAAVVVAAIALTVCVLLAVFGVIPMSSREDLVIPVAGSAIAASVGPIGDVVISDGIGWGLPLAITSLLALGLAGFTPLDLTPSSPLTLGWLALAGVTGFLLYAPLTVALHPPVDLLPEADDSGVRIVEPTGAETLTAGPVTVTVEVTGGSVGPTSTPPDQLPSDPEEAGTLHVYVDGDPQEVTWDDACTVTDPCSRVDIEVEIPEGTSQLTVEFLRGDGVPFAPLVVDRQELTAE